MHTSAVHCRTIKAFCDGVRRSTMCRVRRATQRHVSEAVLTPAREASFARARVHANVVESWSRPRALMTAALSANLA
jgi:hypothetical protein